MTSGMIGPLLLRAVPLAFKLVVLRRLRVWISRWLGLAESVFGVVKAISGQVEIHS